MYKNLKLSVVIPCFNEQDGVGAVLARMPASVDEVVVVDNNCTDATAHVAASLGARVVREAVRGYGAAYKTGLRAATGDLVITMDGDGTYPPEEIERLVDHLLAHEWDFLSANRFPLTDPAAMSWTTRMGNRALTWSARLLFAKPLCDSQSGMWVIRRAVLERLQLRSNGMAFSEEIKVEAWLQGCRFGEAHIPYGARIGEVKLQKWRDGALNLAFLVRKRLGVP